MKEFIYVACGGLVGTLTRYGVQVWMPAANEGFPWAVLLINALGSLFLGWFFTIAIPGKITPQLRLAIGTGFTGAFTTFSTFSLDIVRLFDGGLWERALIYLFVSLVMGLLLCGLGIKIGHRMLSKSSAGGAS
ncbi:CrcB protein [Paenibacillus amylolyticus]|uniref:Fluoride-specific ion channel FluC n=1 Tax=Paenibacillus amylolyticus TaxID=1451 RepID=A0AAP5H1H8_PAEAM|nr:fluoride efflux transporter CrcB [Paenibacillus amylolyticus]MDR6723565.1 CrcB protein [Paenibacillus amylolyticus]